jgi:cellulose synthase/poly-beta-1,6-N-acetylglucosamine synthase-like glycosyltransferase
MGITGTLFGVYMSIGTFLFLTVVVQSLITLLSYVFRQADSTERMNHKVDVLIVGTNERLLKWVLQKWLSNSLISRIILVSPRDLQIENSKIIHVKDDNSGRANAINLGLRHVETEFCLLMDEDNYVTEDNITRMLPYFKNQNVISVSPRMVPYSSKTMLDKLIQQERRVTEEYYQPFASSHGFGTFTGKGMLRTDPARKLSFNSIYLTEDVDFSVRALRIGFNLMNSQAFAYELYPTGLRALVKQRVRWSYGWMQVARKHLFRSNSLMTFFSLFMALIYPVLAFMFPFAMVLAFLGLQGTFFTSPLSIALSSFTMLIPVVITKRVDIVPFYWFLGFVSLWAALKRPRKYIVTDKKLIA